MFNLDQIDKEKYYQEAEVYLKNNNLECLKIDRDKFSVLTKEGFVKIHFQPFYKKTVSKEQLLRAKRTPRIVITNDRYSSVKKGECGMTRENGHLLITLHKEDNQ